MNNYISMEKHMDYVECSTEKYKDLAFEYSCLKEDYEDLEEEYKELQKDNAEVTAFMIFLLISDVVLAIANLL